MFTEAEVNIIVRRMRALETLIEGCDLLIETLEKSKMRDAWTLRRKEYVASRNNLKRELNKV